MLANGTAQFALEQAVKCFFFSVTYLLGETLDSDTTSLIISNLEVLFTGNRARGLVREEVTDLLIIDLSVTDSNRDGLVELV